MKAVYVEEVEKTLKYFVFGLKQEYDECEEYHFKEITTIAERAFSAAWNVKRVFFDECLTTIKKEAFKNCGELEALCCGREDDGKLIKGIETNELPLPSDDKDSRNKESTEKPESEFTVQTSAFENCESLHTVIFPKCGTLKIEKNAFSGCGSLRTVVCLSDSIDFTENPFEDCPKELVFVCSKNSAAERFARENGYRYING